MFETHDLALFVMAGLLLNITPGPDMLYVMSCSATRGARSGAAAALGIGAGCFVHIVAAALGISALLTASATAFTILKICGAAYLVYVGISLLATMPVTPTQTAAPAAARLRTVFAQGFFTNALNPKVALFFLAFVPQFIDQGASNKVLAFLFLGTIFNFNGTLWNLFVAWFAARAGAGLRGSRLAAWMNRCIGGVFIFVGVRLAFAKTA